MILNRAVGGLRRAPWVLLPAVWVAVMGLLTWQWSQGADALPALAVTPALTSAAGARRRWVLGSGVLVLAVLAGDLRDDTLDGAGPVLGAAATVLAVIAAAMCTAGRSTLLTAELDRTREIALAAQQVLLRPLPRRAGGWKVAGEYLSASRGAHVGGDFYEVLVTPYGVRALIGDARGHGLPAIGMVAALLGSFREAAYQEPDLAGVLLRLDDTLRRHLRERTLGEHPAAAGDAPRDPVAEEFATVQLVQLTDDGHVQVVNCGHPQPYLLGAVAVPLPLGEPLPPLGLFEPSAETVPLARGQVGVGEGLLLYTDGMQDARDAAGRFFPLADALVVTRPRPGAPLCGPVVAATLRAAVLRHTGGTLADDMALLTLVRDGARVPAPPRPTALSGVPRR
ncbi:PP2C family protein-serine/threonine phosphatase [Streptomyces sp. NPDC051976]|uniref:PP2C family protein-serine/threonine phosphatase n=1 Tax=Streptomyces sp. NPDC051976 TaxID=3154947 RepID=UPI003425CD70